MESHTEGQPPNSSLAQSLTNIIHPINFLVFLIHCVPGTSLSPLQDGALKLRTLVETEIQITNIQHNVISFIVEFVQYM